MGLFIIGVRVNVILCWLCINIFVWTVFLALDFNTVDFIVEICILLLVYTKKIEANKIIFQEIKAGNC